MRLDAKTVTGLALPPGKDDHFFWDSEVVGFGLRLRRRGDREQKTWVVQYRAGGRSRRPTIGPAATLSPAEARAVARKLLAAVTLGGDPQRDKEAARRAATKTFRAVVQSYLEARASELRPESLRIARLYLTGPYFKSLRGTAVSEIAHADIAGCIRAIERERGSITAAAARRAASTLFLWATKEGLLGRSPVNPVIGTHKPRDAQPRDRVLSGAELVRLWHATAGEDDYDKVVRLLVLTGARAAEIGGMCWSELDLDTRTWRLPAERSKNRRAHTRTLPPAALAIIRSIPPQPGRDFLFGIRGPDGFSKWSEGKRALDERLGDKVKPFKIHDIRRSVATRMAEDLGIAPHTIENVLGHYRKTVATTYNHSRYDREVTSALARWAAHLTDLVEGRKSKVITLRG